MNEKLADNIIQTIFRFDVLNTLPRTGYLIRGISDPETVGEHTFSASVLAILVCDALLAQGISFSTEKVLRMVILHESGEIIIGDIPAPAKRLMGPGVKNEIERKAAKKVLAYFPELHPLIDEYEDKANIEARIVKAIDKLQMMIKVLIYESQGQGRLDDFWEFNANFESCELEFFDLLFERIKQLRGSEIQLDYLEISDE